MIIAQLSLRTDVCGWTVSTVALPIEHPRGANYETGLAEIIGDGDAEIGPWLIHERYETRDEAVAGHIEVCDQIASGMEVQYA